MPDKDNRSAPRRRRWGRWVFAVLLLLFVGVFTAHAIWSWSAQRDLAKVVTGYRAAGEPTTPAELENPYVPDANNAVIEIRAAVALVTANTPAMKGFDKVGLALPLTTKERAATEASIRQGAGIFPLMESAMAKPGIDWKIPVKAPMDRILLPELSPLRFLASFLGVAALAAHEQGDDAKAVLIVREIFFLGKAVDRQPPFVVTHLVATGIRSVGIACVECIAPDLQIASPTTAATRPASLEQVKLLVAELLDETDLRAGYRRSLLGDRVQALDRVAEILSGRAPFPGDGGSGSWTPSMSGSLKTYLFSPLFFTDARMIANAETTAAGLLDEKNFHVAAGRIGQIYAETDRNPRQHMLAITLTPSFRGIVHTQYMTFTEARLNAVSLALRLYQRDHDGHLPDSLTELSPTYLPAVPIDPFARDGSVLHYLPSVSDPRVYSAGENGVDDGGSERAIRASRPVMYRWDSVDAVLHLHRPPRDMSRVMEEMRD